MNGKIHALSAALAASLMASCAAVPAAPAQAPTERALAPVDLAAWQTLPTEVFRGKRDSISFADPMHGWYGTGAGDLFRTQDGGASWSKVASRPGTFVRAVAFLDAENGFIGNVGTDYYPGVEDETPLYRTRDGGATWQAVDLGGQTIKGVCAIDIVTSERIYQGNLEPRTVIHAAGRVGGPTGILRSVDGGETWSVIDMSAQAGMILDIKFFDENTGLVFAATTSSSRDAEGLVLRTTDGGRTWSEVYRSGRPHELIWKASFPGGGDVGYATVQSYDQERATQLVIKTTDGGRSWQELEMAQNAQARQFGIGFIDENTGFVGTFAGGYATNDGGASWREVPIARAANKFDVVRTPSGGRIYAIGTEVQVLDFGFAD